MELKKWLALALTGTMCFSMLAACGGDDEEYVEDEEIVEEEVLEDEELPEDEELVEDEELAEDEYVEDEEPVEDMPITSDTLARVISAKALLGTAMTTMGESYTDETMPEDVKAMADGLFAFVEEINGVDSETYTEDEGVAVVDQAIEYLNVLLQYVDVDTDEVAADLWG